MVEKNEEVVEEKNVEETKEEVVESSVEDKETKESKESTDDLDDDGDKGGSESKDDDDDSVKVSKADIEKYKMYERIHSRDLKKEADQKDKDDVAEIRNGTVKKLMDRYPDKTKEDVEFMLDATSEQAEAVYKPHRDKETTRSSKDAIAAYAQEAKLSKEDESVITSIYEGDADIKRLVDKKDITANDLYIWMDYDRVQTKNKELLKQVNELTVKGENKEELNDTAANTTSKGSIASELKSVKDLGKVDTRDMTPEQFNEYRAELNSRNK